MTKPIDIPRKLIEVALPLDVINEASAKEKSIRHGHPSTLHLWWARRPLAAARAILFAQLVNDPSWKYSPEELKTPSIKGAVTRKRNELFRIISELVKWENTDNRALLERAQAQIRSSWKEACDRNRDYPELFNPNQLPVLHDPFAGGGTIPLEAQRLGLSAFATDLNPVAVLINKATIAVPPLFADRSPVGPAPASEKQERAAGTDDWSGARGLAEDVRRYGWWMRQEATKRLGQLYPPLEITRALIKERPDLKKYEGRTLNTIAWLWARTVASPNPAARGVHVPLASSLVLSSKNSRRCSWAEVVKDRSDPDGWRFSVKCGTGKPSLTETVTRSGAVCVVAGTSIPLEYIRAEGRAGRIKMRMMAIVAEGDNERIYVSPDAAAEGAARAAKPPRALLSEELPGQALGFRVQGYGMRRHRDLYTTRQLTLLSTLCDLVKEARADVLAAALRAGWNADSKRLAGGGSGAAAYADAVSLYLAFAVDKAADRNSALCVWEAKMDRMRNMFGRPTLSMVWDFVETNPLGGAGGDVYGVSVAIWEVLRKSIVPRPIGRAEQRDAQTVEYAGQIVSTDPPYYDNIGYADLSDVFYVWLKRAASDAFPDVLRTILTPKGEELIADQHRHSSRKQADEFFEQGMASVMRRIAIEAHPGFPATIYYAFKQAETSEAGTASTGWERFLSAVVGSGLSVVGTWPLRSELGTRIRSLESNALASSILLVTRTRDRDAVSVSRRDFIRELERAMPLALAEMIADPVASVAPVDLAQAALGPGMAIFSKYAGVIEADGSSMSVHSALVHINKCVDDYFAHAEGDLDADTRFCIGWFQQYGFEPGPFGEADVLARAKGTAVAGIAEDGVTTSRKGKVQLLRVAEYPAGWDPAADKRVSVWEACHHMCGALRESEAAAGQLLARMPEKQDAVRHLAYRLYSLCERKGWAEEARAYNELISSWPALVDASRRAGLKGEQLGLV